jgi:hypothetical protein
MFAVLVPIDSSRFTIQLFKVLDSGEYMVISSLDFSNHKRGSVCDGARTMSNLA